MPDRNSHIVSHRKPQRRQASLNSTASTRPRKALVGSCRRIEAIKDWLHESNTVFIEDKFRAHEGFRLSALPVPRHRSHRPVPPHMVHAPFSPILHRLHRSLLLNGDRSRCLPGGRWVRRPGSPTISGRRLSRRLPGIAPESSFGLIKIITL
jgi:hypothetical protein